MSVLSYRTIQQPAEGMYKEKGSKFLAFAYPVDSEAAIRERLDALRKEYFDARHHCYAWMLGPERKHFRANDDGEPNHSAGDPILGQIRSKELTNILIVVVRYFGGTKLGVGGLISAYKIASEDALSHAIVVEREVTEMITIRYEYASTPEVMKLVKDFDL
ncbi:MAG TPA: YigZ family protein, partial [Ohtaekwangia sp.]|uniref:IMPACT family protein n=1 Tax=Ohtaekwangia sp. TaxID=2066019 RepID=UPI002F936F95